MATADMGNISNSSSYWITGRPPPAYRFGISNIVAALFLPFHIVLCIVFLYFILDWRFAIVQLMHRFVIDMDDAVRWLDSVSYW